MAGLFAYLKPYKKAAILAPLLKLVEVITDLAQPVLMARIVDLGIGQQNLPLILKTGGIMIGAALVGMLAGIGCTYFASFVSQNAGADLRSDLFAKVQSFSYRDLDRFETGSLITRITADVTQLQGMVLAMLRIMVRAPLLCLGGIILALSINPGLASILLVAIPAMAIILFLLLKRGFPLFSQVQGKLDEVNTVIGENLSGIRVVKAFVREEHEEERFEEVNAELAVLGIRAQRIVGLMMPAIFWIMNLSIVAVIWFGGIKVDRGQMMVGEVMAFINYLTQILFSLMMVAFLLMMFSRAKASAARVFEVLATEPTVQEAEEIKKPEVSGKVEFANVSFHYGGSVVLRELSFTVEPGEWLAILGPTGAGKTTLVNLIPRFYDVKQGRVLVDGVDVREQELEDLRKRMGIVPQESVLFSGTIRENLLMGKEDATDGELEAAAKIAQAHNFITSFSDGYETMLGQRGVNLSGGQKQRLALARALLGAPQLLILDDSTSAVDLATEARILAALREQEQTMIMIAQRIATVMQADQILVLNEGELEALGTHSQLLKASPLYREIYRSQLGKEAI